MVNRSIVVNNDSVARDYGHESTPKPKIISIKEIGQQSNASFILVKSSSSAPIFPVKSISKEEISQFADEINNEEQVYDQQIKQIRNELVIALEDYSLESETMSKAEELVCQIADKYSLRFLGEVLTEIYVGCYSQQNVISGICSSLERFDAEEVSPWGQSIVIGLVNHKSDLVKERVVSLIENWSDTSLLPALKSIEISSAWMKEYINGVITYLEEKRNVLRKEAF